jgi:hypothetical protein
MSVKIRLAAGLIIFRRHLEQVEYLLLESTYDASHWTPPKGLKIKTSFYFGFSIMQLLFYFLIN